MKSLKKQILMRPLIIPNSFLFKENSKNNNNKYIKRSNIYNNYLSNKISSSEINSIFIYNNSISNSNTTKIQIILLILK